MRHAEWALFEDSFSEEAGKCLLLAEGAGKTLTAALLARQSGKEDHADTVHCRESSF